jgi:hypothetical protein
MRFKLIITLAFAFFIAACVPSLTSSGQGKTATYVVSEKEFYQNKMFFLDTAYRSFYLGKRATVPDVKSEKLQLWLCNMSIFGEAYENKNTKANIYKYFGIARMPFKLLKMGTDYNLDNRWKGVVRFDSIFISQNDILGIHLETEDSAVIANRGVYWDSGDTSQIVADTPWTLKFSWQDSTYPTFPLMWRNIYILPAVVNIANFDIRIVLARDSMIDRALDGRLFTEVLGLSDKNGMPYSSNNHIFDFERSLLIIPAFDSSGRGNEPFSNPALGLDNTNTRIYKNVGSDFSEKTPLNFKIIYSQPVK